MKETINFHIKFDSMFWDLPPMARISVNDQIKFDGAIDRSEFIVTFDETLDFDRVHTLYINRYNKLPGQCIVLDDGRLQDQVLILQQLKIDGIDVQSLINTISYNRPEYPEPWATEQRSNGVELEETVLAETWFGHNGTWSLTFTSPFYKFLYKNIG